MSTMSCSNSRRARSGNSDCICGSDIGVSLPGLNCKPRLARPSATVWLGSFTADFTGGFERVQRAAKVARADVPAEYFMQQVTPVVSVRSDFLQLMQDRIGNVVAAEVAENVIC